MSKDKKSIVIKKVRGGGHGGHHGGAWKVAYADFVTAMMAFFLLLWLLSCVPQKKLDDLAHFFAPTIGIKDQEGIGVKGGLSDTIGMSQMDTGNPGIIYGAPTTGSAVDIKKTDDPHEQQVFTQFKDDVNNAIRTDSSLKDYADNIDIQDTPEGLMISLVDSKNRPMFVPGTNTLQPYTKQLLAKISGIIRFVPNYLDIRTQTNNEDAQVEPWSLSAQRSIATRLYLLTTSIDPEQIARVTGEGDWNGGNTNNKKINQINLILLKNSLLAYQHKFGASAVSLQSK